MQELRLVMIVIGAVAIAALLIHGLWTSRRERPEKFGERPIQKVVEQKDGFDLDGVGAVRVIKQTKSTEDPDELSTDALLFENEPKPKQMQKKTAGKKTLRGTANQSKMKTVKDFYHFEDTEEDIALAEQEQSLQKKDTEQASAIEEPTVSEEKPVEPSEPEQQVLVFNVQALPNKPFKGEELFSCLEQYGMHFGEMNIFHRHVESSGTGKVLFSAANMLNPGSFPVSSINQFTTPGITFFMTLPCYGEAEPNLKLMLQTAQQVADLLGGQVTDDHRNLLTPKRIDEYRDRVKQFVAVA